MKSLFSSLLVVTALLSQTALGYEFGSKPVSPPPPPVTPPAASQTLQITKDNVAVLNGVVNNSSVDKFLKDLQTLPSNDVILYLNSPGGSVVAGMRVVDYILKSGKTFTCVGDTAASMAFIILQACHKRVATLSSVLMQHQAAWGVDGQDARNKSMIRFLDDLITSVDVAQAKRLKLSLEDFRAKVNNDWWVSGVNAQQLNVVDATLLPICSKDLVEGTDIEELRIFGLDLKVTRSKCPLVKNPLKVEFKDYYVARNLTKEQEANYEKALKELNFADNMTSEYIRKLNK